MTAGTGNKTTLKRNIMFGTGASSYKDFDGLYTVIKAAFENDITGFDTAPSYGTEEILGKCLAKCMNEFGMNRSEIYVQTKVDAWQMMESKNQIKSYVTGIMEKMQLEYLDALLVHWPVPEYLEKTWEAFEELRDSGLVRHVGICNVRMRQLNAFLNWDVKPEIIQIERNPLRTCEREVAFCREHGIDIQAYSPLCKFHEDIRTSTLLADIANNHKKNIGQAVMRWHIDTGVVPVFTSKKPSRIKEYAELSDFALEPDEIGAINGMNRDYKMYLEACACPGF